MSNTGRGTLFGRGGGGPPLRTDETAESLERHNDAAIIMGGPMVTPVSSLILGSEATL